MKRLISQSQSVALKATSSLLFKLIMQFPTLRCLWQRGWFQHLMHFLFAWQFFAIAYCCGIVFPSLSTQSLTVFFNNFGPALYLSIEVKGWAFFHIRGAICVGWNTKTFSNVLRIRILIKWIWMPTIRSQWCRLTNPRAQCPHKMKNTSVLCCPYFTPGRSSLCLDPTEVLNGKCIHIDVIYRRWNLQITLKTICC